MICNGNHSFRIADRKTNEKNEITIWDLWNNIKHANLHITGIPEGQERENRAEETFE